MTAKYGEAYDNSNSNWEIKLHLLSSFQRVPVGMIAKIYWIGKLVNKAIKERILTKC